MMRLDKGFTLMEILMTVAIMTIITAILVVSFSKLNSQQVLDKSSSLVVSIVDEARSLTFSAKDDSQYGVHFEASGVVLFKGIIYSSTDPLNVVTTIDSRVGIRNILLTGGGSSIVFKRLTGSTDQSGTVELFLKTSTTSMRTITISTTGVVGAN